MRLAQAAEIAGASLKGDPSYEIEKLASLGKSGPGCLTFVVSRDSEAVQKAVEKGAAVFCMPGLSLERGAETQNPYLSFVKVMNVFTPKMPFEKGVHPAAFVSKEASLGQDVFVGPNAVVCKNASLGEGSFIGANCFIGENASIGSKCVVYPNVTILRDCKIGDRVIIHSGAVIGSDGFGYLRDKGEVIKIPQTGKVIIEDDVEIGANSTVDRATLDETIIRKGTKIDNLVQIAHNVIIGENCLIASQTGISGSAEVGSGVMMAGQVGIADHAKIGKNAVILAKSGVSGSVPEGAVYLWIPATDVSKAKRIIASLKFLPQMAKKLRKFEK
ncbi:UDP-3-O-(3-hydroxymyristoyl)glucosamine N-acyltransferase [candidate division WOR-3 bacterium]|nr:UDP-3-O-(3-hydroxymyristoyl)glucosamine N-acyltransferase [candidate division WOR-3 bacterium]